MAITLNQAFAQTPRRLFLPDDSTQLADYDFPVPIGHGQTNSQPSTVFQMLDWLSVEPGNKILDVGCGSGWTTALLSRLTGSEGRVIGVELIPELVEFGRSNCQQLLLSNVTIKQAGKNIGDPSHAPYDRILVSAAADTLPTELVDQLSDDGIMVIPIQSSIHVIEKIDGKIDDKEYPGYVFVPLIKGK